MFKAKTVFIIGAGASCHYGCPTGEALVKNVQKKAGDIEAFLREAAANTIIQVEYPEYAKKIGPSAADQCKDLYERLKVVEPLVIDYFIGQSRPLEEIAKLCIAWEILECESREEEYLKNAPINVSNNWYRFLVHKLVTNCVTGEALLDNNVKFIIFNYDLSLDRRLRRGLRSLHQFEGTADEFLNDRIVHVYGKIRDDVHGTPRSIQWDKFPKAKGLEEARRDYRSPAWLQGKSILDEAYKASQGIQIIAPDKAETTAQIETAKRVIADAECVYILGYGFDSVNNKMLGLLDALRANSSKWRHVLFTNYGNRGTVNKTASRMFFNDEPDYLSEDRNQLTRRLPFTCEKSIGTVYEAFAYDFDSPEERPSS